MVGLGLAKSTDTRSWEEEEEENGDKKYARSPYMHFPFHHELLQECPCPPPPVLLVTFVTLACVLDVLCPIISISSSSSSVYSSVVLPPVTVDGVGGASTCA